MMAAEIMRAAEIAGRPILALLAGEIERMRAAGVPVGEDELRGLYIPDAEADRLLGEEAEEAAEERIAALANACGLSELEDGIVRLCLAAETRPGIERLIAYAQDDVSRRRPRVELALRLLSENPLDALGAFDEQMPLRRHRLVELLDEPGQPATPLPSKTLVLDDRVLRFLLGGDGIDAAIATSTRVHPAPGPLHAATPEVDLVARHPATALRPPVVALWGPDPGRIRDTALYIATRGGLDCLVEFDATRARDGASGADDVLARAGREAALQHGALLVTGIDALEAPARDHLIAASERSAAPLTLLASEAEAAFPGPLLHVPGLDYESRLELWNESLSGMDSDAGTDEIAALAGKFRLGKDAITAAVRTAHGRAVARDPDRPSVGREDLYAGARAQSAPILGTLASKISPHYVWDDIVLEDDPLEQLREFCGMIEHRHLVYDTWGFDRKLAMGKGVIALFAGQSGTGKTMAADVMAGQLGLELYKIDLSGVVSKYIGETEKNIGAIFRDAESSNAILFFDEADALFGKRSEVRDAHDRYANIETAYLLQRMEEYSGAVILSTNLKMNLDEAFLRRMHFVIDFPMPEEPYRLRIWKSTIPPELPLDPGIDLAFLARQFKISGGNIRNIVLAAAFLAAEDGGPMGMRHLIRATRREFQKLGRMVTEAEFGDHIAYLR
jgi:hypothetical protein